MVGVMYKTNSPTGNDGLGPEALNRVCGSADMKTAYAANIIGAFSMAIMDKMTKAVVKASGLSASACHAIVTIGTEPGSTIDEIRRMLDLDHSSVVRAIAKLENIGAVEKNRKKTADGRAVTVNLSGFGKELFATILNARASLLSTITSALSADDLNYSIDFIHKVMPSVVDEGDDQHKVCRLCDISNCEQSICPVNLAYIYTKA